MTSLRQLRYFLALAATGHFGRAARALGITQPALSMQLRELEATLGGPLIERGAAGCALTDLGREVEQRTGHILAAVRDLEDLAQAHGETPSGPLHLGIIPSVAPYLLPRLLAAVGETYPALRLTIRETITNNLVEELAAGELDAVVASLPLDDADFEEAPAFDDPFLLAAPTGSPQAKQSPALTRLIKAEDLLLLEDGHCLRDQALSVCHRIDPHRLRSFGATSLSTVLQLVAAGQGITLVPQLAVDAGLSSDPRLTLVRFAEPQPRRTIGLAWRRNSPRRRDFEALTELVRTAGTTAGHAESAA